MTKPTRDARILSGAYVLDALTPQEVLDMEAAMRGDEDLRGEVAELTDTAVLLGLAVPVAEPPAALRSRLLEAIEHTPQVAPEEALDESGEHDAEPEIEPRHRATAIVTVGPAHWFRRPVALLAAAAAATALLFGGGLLVQRATDPSVSTQQAGPFSDLMRTSDLRSARTPVSGGGTAVVYWSPSRHRSAVVLTGVTVPTGRTLQLWHLRTGSVSSAGLYAQGDRYQMLSGMPSAGERIGVTIEPKGGSAKPTTPPIAVVSLA